MGTKKSEKLSFYTRPWFVIGIVITCFAILTPKIFIPLFRQLIGAKSTEQGSNNFDRMPPPHLRTRYVPNQNPSEAPTQFGRPNPLYNPQAQGTSSSGKSILTFFLPVYAIGIGLYMLYTLYKVFNKQNKKDNDDEDSDYDSYKGKIFDFNERNYGSNFVWDTDSNQSRTKKADKFCRTEETDDEMDNYEKYKNLDPDYVNHVKNLRRRKRNEARKVALNSTKAADIAETGPIPLTKNIGLSSVTNTNVLLNETLERMKYSLNKINKQICETEKKGESLDDPDLDDLRLQLAQTEQQMAKIVKIISTVSVDLSDSNIVIDENFDSENDFETKELSSKKSILKNSKSKNDSIDEIMAEESSSSNYSIRESPVQNTKKKKTKNKENVKPDEKKVTFNESNIKKSKKKKFKKKKE